MSEVFRDQYEWSDNQAWTYTATVDATEFGELLDSVHALVDECVLHITPEEVHVRAIDPASVAAMRVAKPIVASADGVLAVGVNLNELEDLPPFYRYDNEYKLKVEHGAESSFEVIHETEGYVTADAFNPESVRQLGEGNFPEVEPKNEIALSAAKIRGLLGGMAESYPTGHLQLTPKRGSLLVETVDRNEGVQGSWEMEMAVDDGKSVLYSADFLCDIIDGLPADGDVLVRFGHEQPLTLFNDGTEYAIAPRLEDNEVR